MTTLDSGINVPPGITVAPPLENFYITILILFYINLGIAVIFKFFLSSKIIKKGIQIVFVCNVHESLLCPDLAGVVSIKRS